MPELPETETIARDLERELRGRRIVHVRVARPDVLREVDASELARRVGGATIQRCWRRAKLVVLDLSTGEHLVVQPRFTGALLLDAGALPEQERRYSTVAVTLDDARVLHYRDIRRLGTVALMSAARFAAYEARLGVEPLDPSFSPSRLSELVRGSRQAVKKVLMDQRRVVGIGNIYANEALWRARLHPARAARSLESSDVAALHAAVTGVLADAVEARGTSFRDYRDASGERGSFAEQLAVYGRAGGACRRCATTLVTTHEIDGRSTVFCPACQR